MMSINNDDVTVSEYIIEIAEYFAPEDHVRLGHLIRMAFIEGRQSGMKEMMEIDRKSADRLKAALS